MGVRRLWTALCGHSESRVSSAWLRSQDRLSSRVDYEGVSIRWPIQKTANESPLWQTRKLKRRA